MLALLCLVATATRLTAVESNAVTFTEPAEAGIDYKLQGEYSRKLELDEGQRKIAAQVVALGESLPSSSPDPLTAIGLTVSNKLLLVTVDGGQPGFSEGLGLAVSLVH